MNPCTIAIWKCQVTGLLAKGFFYEGQMWVTGYQGPWLKLSYVSNDPAYWDFWSDI